MPLLSCLLLTVCPQCPDVRRCQVTGLNGCTFLDRTRAGPEGPPGSPPPQPPAYQECREVVQLNEYTDRWVSPVEGTLSSN